ncbi:MAG: PEP-CTERM sorting domain-containing protein [Spongiibacteraceae bacterium]
MKSLHAILMTTAVLMFAPAAAWSDAASTKHYEAPTTAQSQHATEGLSSVQATEVQAKRYPGTPEPTRLALLAAGLIGVVFMRRIVSRAN